MATVLGPINRLRFCSFVLVIVNNNNNKISHSLFICFCFFYFTHFNRYRFFPPLMPLLHFLFFRNQNGTFPQNTFSSCTLSASTIVLSAFLFFFCVCYPSSLIEVKRVIVSLFNSNLHLLIWFLL